MPTKKTITKKYINQLILDKVKIPKLNFLIEDDMLYPVEKPKGKK